MISVSIVNVTSYTGMELLRLLAQHPRFVVTSVTARRAAGQHLGEVFPHLSAWTSARALAEQVIASEPERSDLAFVCLPHAAAAEAVVALLEQDTKVVDLSADFRLHDAALYQEWYRHTHPVPDLLESAVYGLCERYRADIEGASLVANPGCHATAAILALLPACAAGLITPDVVIDSKSGVSGAGRSLSLGTHYAEVNEDVSAYSLNGHRHLPEIVQELEAVSPAGEEPLRITFVPHLIPMTRGILATCYANLRQEMTTAEVRTLYEAYYADEAFVHVVDQAPHTKWTSGSNQCLLYPLVDSRTRRLVVVSCLDNLVKGAAGQAIQNANRLFRLPETTGLPAQALIP
ncbi:MAG: N-acetyl-gamma-glutamyl-phosphate reductase [Ktedonobacteraceae bacterium]|nr:N-acetyl-gamma-glutamyl-phosphate reductase [Chloroflexota bacterium]